MFEFLFYIGIFCLVIGIGYPLFMVIMFLINKFMNHDDISFIEYAKRWDW